MTLSKTIPYIILFSLLSSAFSFSHGLHENELTEEIDRFLQASRRASLEAIDPHQERRPLSISREAPLLDATKSAIGTALETALWMVGATFRTTGDLLRPGNLEKDPPLTELEIYRHNAQNMAGNSLRAVGAFFVGEKPTLPRHIRKFWTARELRKTDFQEIYISTAAALHTTKLIQEDVERRNTFWETTIKINSSSRFKGMDPVNFPPSTGTLLELLLQGIIRSEVRKNNFRNDATIMDYFNRACRGDLSLDNLPFLASITPASIFGANLEQQKIEDVTAALQQKKNEMLTQKIETLWGQEKTTFDLQKQHS